MGPRLSPIMHGQTWTMGYKLGTYLSGQDNNRAEGRSENPEGGGEQVLIICPPALWAEGGLEIKVNKGACY